MRNASETNEVANGGGAFYEAPRGGALGSLVPGGGSLAGAFLAHDGSFSVRPRPPERVCLLRAKPKELSVLARGLGPWKLPGANAFVSSGQDTLYWIDPESVLWARPTEADETALPSPEAGKMSGKMSGKISARGSSRASRTSQAPQSSQSIREEKIRRALGTRATATLVELSEAFSRFEIRGKQARFVLQKFIALDFSRALARSGQLVHTRFGAAHVMIACLGSEAFLFQSRVSFTPYCVDLLETALAGVAGSR